MRVVILALLALVACKKSADPVVARLEQTTAQVERMPRANAAWQPAKIGDTFIIGSAVRTGAGAQAKLRVGKSGKLDVSENAVVYFTRTPGRDRSDLRVESGAIELESGSEAVGIGEAVLEPGGRAHVEHGPEGTTIVVSAGRAILEDNVIAAGQTITLGAAGKPLPAIDAGLAVAASLPPPVDGHLAGAVRDKPAKLRTAAGAFELPIGEQPIARESTIDVPAGSRVELPNVVVSGPSEVAIDKQGAIELRRGSVDVRGGNRLSVPGGTVTPSADGDALVTVTGKVVTIDVLAGTVTIATASASKTLDAGRSATLNAEGQLQLAAPPPERTVTTVIAGESATIHDPRAPTPVKLAFGSCASKGVIEVAKDRAFKKLVARSSGATSANVLVPAGSYSYRLRCGDGTVTTASLRVDKASGKAPLPKTAARTTVEMDGREYTILYQNLLPEVTLAWRNAPKKASYTFVIKPARGADKRIASASPTTRLAAGELREGSYKVWVEPASGSRSEESRIVIDFDNAAASASIDSAEAAGGAIRVKGTVIESSTVSASGSPVALDRHRRFETELTPRDREDGVGLRIAHPQGGIHYYVMRTAAP